jgi:hypothetical protein
MTGTKENHSEARRAWLRREKNLKKKVEKKK